MSLPILRIIGSVAGIVSLLVAAGYLSLRAHLNHLGISALEVIGTERILSESLPLALGLLMDGMGAGILFGIGILAAISAGRALNRPLASLQRNYIGTAYFLRRHFRLSVIVLFYAAYLLWHIYLIEVLDGANGVVVGALDQAKINSCPGWIWHVHAAVFLLAMYVGLGLIWSRSNGWRRRLARLAGSYLLASGFIATPMVFGAVGRPEIYPTAVVSLGELEKPQCGLLVMITTEQLVLWRAENKIGRALYLPRSRVQSVITGVPRNIVDLARQALQDVQAYPSKAVCDELMPASRMLP